MPIRTSVANDSTMIGYIIAPLHPALDLRLLLDLVGDAVEHDVQDSRGLAGLDHGDEEAREDLRMAGHRLGEEEAALDVGAQLGDDRRELLVLGLLLEDDERGDDVQPASIIVANWREKIWRDFALTFLTARPGLLPAEPWVRSSVASSPRRRSCSRAGRRRRGDLARQLRRGVMAV